MGTVKTPSTAPRRRLRTSPFADRVEAAAPVLAPADRVTHEKYGLGEITSVGDGFVVVRFGSDHVRVASPFSRLTAL
jgi:hypothetical protein